MNFTAGYFQSEKKKVNEFHAGQDFSYAYFDCLKFYDAHRFLLKGCLVMPHDWDLFLRRLTKAELTAHTNRSQASKYEDYVTGQWRQEGEQFVLEWSLEDHPAPLKGFNPYVMHVEWMNESVIRDNMGYLYHRQSLWYPSPLDA